MRVNVKGKGAAEQRNKNIKNRIPTNEKLTHTMKITTWNNNKENVSASFLSAGSAMTGLQEGRYGDYYI